MPASASRVNQTLSNYAAGVAQDKTSAIARFICPVVPTGTTNGQYKKYDSKNDFQAYVTDRAIGGNRKRIEFAATDPFFNCKPHGLEVPVDDHERQSSGANENRLAEGKIRTLVTTATLSHELAVMAAVKAGKAATGSIGVWSNAANDPIDEIDSQIEAIATETGRYPNKLVLGVGAWRILKNHAKVLTRQPGAGNIGVTMAQFAAMLLNPEIQIKVGLLSRDTVKFGAAKNAVSIVGGEVFLFYGEDQPDQYDPSFAKCFSTTPSMVDAVREYREDRSASDIYYVDWSQDIVVTAPECGRRITLS